MELAGAYYKLGTIQGNPQFQNLGQPVEAMASFRKSVAIAEKLLAGGQPDSLLLRRLADTYFYMGLLERRNNKLAEARQDFQRSLKIVESLMAASKKNDDLYWLLLNGSHYLGEVDALINGEAEAVPLNQNLVAINERWLAEFPGERARSSMGISYNRLGEALLARGDLDEAFITLNRALAAEVELQRAAPNNVVYRSLQAQIHHDLGKVLGGPGSPNLGRSTEAVAHYRQAVAIEAELAAADSLNVMARTLLKIYTNDLALALLESAPQEAAALYQKMLDSGNNAASGARPTTSTFQLGAYVNLARALWRTGDRAGATQILQEVETSMQKDLARLGNDHGLQLAHGQLLLEMGEPANALTQFQRALPQLKENSAKFPDSLWARRQLVDLYEALGQAYALRAAQTGSPPAQQIADWRAARVAYQQCLDLWNAWPRWAVSNIYNPRRAAATLALTQCEAALAKF